MQVEPSRTRLGTWQPLSRCRGPGLSCHRPGNHLGSKGSVSAQTAAGSLHDYGRAPRKGTFLSANGWQVCPQEALRCRRVLPEMLSVLTRLPGPSGAGSAGFKRAAAPPAAPLADMRSLAPSLEPQWPVPHRASRGQAPKVWQLPPCLLGTEVTLLRGSSSPRERLQRAPDPRRSQ